MGTTRTRPAVIKHGTSSGYTIGECRCDDCTRAQRSYNKRWRLHQHLGRPALSLPVQPVRDHVQSLMDAGMSFNAVSLAAGYKSRNALVSALAREKVQRKTYERIMGVSLESDTRETRFVDATATRRRLQALMVIGHSSRTLAELLGHGDHSGVLDITNGTPKIRALTELKVAAIYDDLWDKPGPAKRTAGIAKRKGWSPPLAWDDDTIGDPNSTPCGDWKPSTSNEVLLEDWHDTFWEHQGDVRAAATRLGVSWAALSRALYRARTAGATLSFYNVHSTKEASA